MAIFLTEENRGLLSTGLVVNDVKDFVITSGSNNLISKDREIVVFHKRTYKTMQYKEVGQKFIVFFVDKDSNAFSLADKLSIIGFEQALNIFVSFDEETGEKKPFVLHYGAQKATLLMEKFALLDQANILNNDYLTQENDGQFYLKGVKQKNGDLQLDTVADKLSYLFSLCLMYGKLQIVNSDLLGVKIHIPYFGQFTSHIEIIKKIVADLFENQSLFVDVYDDDKGVLELVVNDYQILEQFAVWYKPIASLTKIPKKDSAIRYKEGLLSFLKDNGYNDSDISMLEDGIVKPLLVS